MAMHKLTYFDFPSSRGEECRLALHLAGIPFDDDRVKLPDWPARKSGTPFGSMPVLTVEGHPPLAQTNAILCLIGRKHGLHPKEEWEAARHEALMGAIEDFRGRLTPMMRIKDAEEKKRVREEFAAGYLQEWATAVEKQIGDGPFVAGAQIQVVDLKLFVTLNSFVKGVIDHIPTDVFKPFPKLMRLYEAARSHPKVVSWYAR